MTTTTAADALKYAAARLNACTEWATDSIGGSLCDHGHDDEIDAINDVVTQVHQLATQYGDPHRYSNGRLIKSSAWIINPGLMTSHIWHPDPTAEQPSSWRGELPHDPDEPSPGVYEVTLEPTTQDIHVRVVRVA